VIALLLAAALMASAGTAPHVADGPAAGSSSRFAVTIPTQITADVRARALPRSVPGPWPPELEIPDLPDRAHAPRPTGPRGANEQNDAARSSARGALLRPKGSTILAGFSGIDDTGARPPDPIIAAGPDHVVVAVNSAWAIYTKSGTKVFETTAFGWFLPVLTQVPNGDLFPYDPQVAYDPFRGRWILLYSATDLTSESFLLLSVSSSSDPTAPWYSWALPGDVNGASASSNLSDFPALAYDDTAIYVATNQFRYADHGFDYARVRILAKDPLYAGSSTAAWVDFWNLQDPEAGAIVHSARPVRTSGSPGVEYLVSNSPFTTRTFVTLWSLAAAGTPQPSLSAADVPVTASAAPPGADQEDGSPGTSGCPTPCLIDTGIGVIASAVYRNGSVWLAHTVGDPSGAFSRARYVRIGAASQTVLEDASFGAAGCWYFYPAVAVDPGDNLSMVFGRSCTDAYAGVGLTVRTISDAALEPSVILKDGRASYVVPVGTGEPVNRWGDFFGAAPDPSDPGKIWTFGQYADLHERWSTWIAETSVSFVGGSCVADDTSLCLGDARFRATATWKNPDGSTGSGQAVPVTGDTGYFWFFDESNIEVVAKVLDACGVNDRFWVFLGGLTNLDVTLTVADTKTNASRTYVNAAGTPFAPVQDTSALPCP
jgi:hypothetical protein